MNNAYTSNYDDHPMFANENSVERDAYGFANVMRIKLPARREIPQGSKMSFSKGSIYYSWPNIDAVYGNNILAYRWTNGTVYTLTLPTQFYTVTQLNNALHAYMKSLGHYTAGTPDTFYINIVENAQTLLLDFVTTPFSGTAPALVIPNAATGNLLGLPVGQYPSSLLPTQSTFSSSSIPQFQPQTSVYITCDQLNPSEFASNGQERVLYNFTPDVPPASMIDLEQIDQLWLPIATGRYDEFVFRLTDQLGRPLNILDGTMVFTIIIRKPIPINTFE